MYHRKAQGLSMRTVVVAAILLIVLLVLVLIFIRRSAEYESALNECNRRGGTCTLSRFCNGPEISSDCGGVTEEETLGSGSLEWIIRGDDVVCCIKLKE